MDSDYSHKNNLPVLKKQIEKVWWVCAIGTILFAILGQMRSDPSILAPTWTVSAFAFSFFGFLFSSVAWGFASHFEYVRNLERKVEELEKRN